MSSLTGDLSSSLAKIELNNNPVTKRNALSTVKKRRQVQRRPYIEIAPLRLEEIRKAIEQADTEQRTCERPQIIEEEIENKENDVEEATPLLQESFELNFANLDLNTPAKPFQVKNEKFATPATQVTKFNRALDFQYVTPNNKIPAKVQWSVKMKPFKETPVTKVYAPCDQPKSNDLPAVNIPTSPVMDLKKIKVNNDTYIILNELGKGGSSEVFHCYNLHSKVHRAIKVVSLENKVSAVGFINEVKLLKTLQKCNRIIKMFDYEIKAAEKVLFVVLEVGGSDLSKILKESAVNSDNTHMPHHMLFYYWMEMLYAVKQIHSNGIIHSDLKPANFLQVDGYLKLIDFGIASCIQSDMSSVIKTVPEGSFNYISPEALSNDTSSNINSPSYGKPKYKLKYKSDVWSLGCILYQLVYRKTPFQHITQVWMKLATIVDPNHRIEYPDVDWVPSKIINTIKSCLQVNVNARPSVNELIAEYEDGF